MCIVLLLWPWARIPIPMKSGQVESGWLTNAKYLLLKNLGIAIRMRPVSSIGVWIRGDCSMG